MLSRQRTGVQAAVGHASSPLGMKAHARQRTNTARVEKLSVMGEAARLFFAVQVCLLILDGERNRTDAEEGTRAAYMATGRHHEENIIMRENKAQTRHEDGTWQPTARHTARKQHDSSMQTASENGTRAQESIITISARPRLLIIGRTASGKDTLADALRRSCGMTFVKSCTTRPRRTPDEDTHVFLTERQAEPLVQDAVAYTKIGDYIYFTTAQQVMETEGYVIDPIGMRMLCGNMPGTSFVIAYVHADSTERRQHALRRGDAARESAAFAARDASEDAEFDRFEQDIAAYDAGDATALPKNVATVISIENRYDESFPHDAVLAIRKAIGTGTGTDSQG